MASDLWRVEVQWLNRAASIASGHGDYDTANAIYRLVTKITLEARHKETTDG